jgi:hypothetical protein
MNTTSSAPVLNVPADGAVSVILLPSFTTTSTDPNGDYLQYMIQLCTNVLMTLNCQTFDQTSSQTGWSNQNTQGNTAYISGNAATYTLSSSLNRASTYYWRSYAKDPGGSNAWSATQPSPFSFTTTNTPVAATGCMINQTPNNSSYTIKWNDVSTDENGYEVKRSVDGGAYSTLVTGLAANTTSYQDTTITTGHTYSYQIAPYYSPGPIYGQWCTTTKLTVPQPAGNVFSFN